MMEVLIKNGFYCHIIYIYIHNIPNFDHMCNRHESGFRSGDISVKYLGLDNNNLDFTKTWSSPSLGSWPKWEDSGALGPSGLALYSSPKSAMICQASEWWNPLVLALCWSLESWLNFRWVAARAFRGATVATHQSLSVFHWLDSAMFIGQKSVRSMHVPQLQRRLCW